MSNNAKDLLRGADGRVWSLANWGTRVVEEVIQDSEAALACIEAGGILAEAKDLQALMRLLGAETLTRNFLGSQFSAVGLNRLQRLIPAMKNRRILLSSVDPDHSGYALYVHHGNNGDLDHFNRASDDGAALCVGR